jgi:hypothetical protein
LRAAFGAGLVGAVISLLLGPIAGAPAGGFLSVVFFRRRSWPAEVSTSAGFRLGSLAGAFGSAIFLLVKAVQTSLTHSNEMRDAMIEAIHRQLARNPDPEAQRMLEYFLSPHGLTLIMALAAVFMAIIFICLSGIGGMISARLLRRKV